MKLKLNDIININGALEVLMDKELDFATACDISTNVKALATPMEVFEKKRNVIIDKYAEKDEKGELRRFDDNSVKIIDVDNFNAEMSELLRSDVDLEVVKISKKALTDIKIAPKNLLALSNIISED